MKYKQCADCMCSTCANADCAANECDVCEKLQMVLSEDNVSYPNVRCFKHKYKPQPVPDTKCICCGAAVPFGSVYCPNCLITLVKP